MSTPEAAAPAAGPGPANGAENGAESAVATAENAVGTGASSAVEQRLAELGLTLPAVAAPVAAYVPAVISGNHVYTSGQLPFIDGKLPATGKVGSAAVSAEDAKSLAATCAVNALAAVKSVIGDLDRITRIVKVVGFVSSDPSFTGQPGVINGASE